jgi:hypothetical protein
MTPQAGQSQADDLAASPEVSETRRAPRSVKLTVNLPQAEMRVIRTRAGENHETVTQLLRRAIGTTLFLDEEVARGGRVLVERRDRTLVEVVFPGTPFAAHAAGGHTHGRSAAAESDS